MKRTCIFIIALVFVACANRSQKTRTEESVVSIAAKPLIDSMLVWGINELLEASSFWDGYELPPLERSCLVMEFDINLEPKPICFSDSMICITNKICGKSYPLDKYKGILSVNNVNVAIFDVQDMGTEYYNADSVKMIPFDSFECYPVKSHPGMAFTVKKGVLDFWNP